MKKTDVEDMVNRLVEVRDFASKKLDYNSSTYINQQLIKIIPVLNAEYERLNNEKVVINSPKLLVLGTEDVDTDQTLIDFANTKMSELVENNYKILDFGLYSSNNGKTSVYIKYTD